VTFAAEGGGPGGSSRPTPNKPIPDKLWQEYYPKGVFENVVGGAQEAYGRPHDWLDTIDAPNAYEAAKKFGQGWWRDGPRKVRRLLGDTPINRFIFEAARGTKAFEVWSAGGGTNKWYITETPRTWPRARGKKGVPLWSQVNKGR